MNANVYKQKYFIPFVFSVIFINNKANIGIKEDTCIVTATIDNNTDKKFLPAIK
jgi:hypothetical protein